MILVTGATGLAGRRLVRRLAALRQRVRALSRNPEAAFLAEQVEWVHGDLSDPASLTPALQGVGTVVHLAAALPRKGMSDAALEAVNVRGTHALARAARGAGVRRFIQVSSAGVYGDGGDASPHPESDPPAPATPYERSKLAAEHAVADAFGEGTVSWTILRPAGLYAADRPATIEFFRAVQRRRLWLLGPARVLVHPTHVDDLVAAIEATLAHEGLTRETINVGGDRALEFRELVALVGRRVGRVPFRCSVPGWTIPVAAVVASFWKRVGTPPPALSRLTRRWVNRAVSLEKARRLLGFQPIPLERGLDATAAELRQQGRL